MFLNEDQYYMLLLALAARSTRVKINMLTVNGLQIGSIYSKCLLNYVEWN